VTRESFGERAVIKDSPADKAGIKEDDILLEADGEKISEDNTLADILARHKVGDEIEFKILRGWMEGKGKEISLKVKLEEKK
jgi:serine protease Do